MDEIKVDVPGIRMINNGDGTYQLILVALNEMRADVLRHTLGKTILLSYVYDGSDITFYLEFKLCAIDKMFRVPVNANVETRKWLNLIDEKTVKAISICHWDGKGGLMFYDKPVPVIR